MRNVVLSICLSGHGLSGAVLIDGDVKVATTLERISRVKNDILFPITREDLVLFGWNQDISYYERNLDLPFDSTLQITSDDFKKSQKFESFLNYLFQAANISINQINVVVYTFRFVKQAKNFFENLNPRIKFFSPEHHLAHSAQAFLGSGFSEAAILVLDGQGICLDRIRGNQLSGVLAYGNGNKIDIIEEIPVMKSIGSMYSQFTSHLGFKTNEEGKTMGLAAYGKSEIYDQIKNRLQFNVFKVNIVSYFLKRDWKIFRKHRYILPNYYKILKKFPKRGRNQPINHNHQDLAFCVQKITEEVMIELANYLHKKTNSSNLCIAGGVGLNCVANYQVLIHSKFDNIFVHPNPGDNGIAIGQALLYNNTILGNPREYVVTTDSLGKIYTDTEIENAIKVFTKSKSVDVVEFINIEKMYAKLSTEIQKGKIVSWFQGKSEFGPRALGNRSILADPRNPKMKDILNSRVKFRESFRPFTPSVLQEHVEEYFEIQIDSPFMLFAAYVKPGKAKLIPAVTHEDNTARIQTVSRVVNDRYYDLINKFFVDTGIPMLLDTSFNVAGEPIVETPKDAIECFYSTDIDLLCIGRFIITKLGS